MLRRHLLCSTFFISAAAVPAMADISPTDVWDNTKALYAATGATVTGTPRVDGDVIIVDDGALLYALPFGAGTVTATLPPLRMSDNGDGTVSLMDTGAFDLKVDMDISGEPPVSVTLNMTQTDYTGLVSGTPEEMIYDYRSGPYEVRVTDISIPEDEVVFDMAIAGEGYDAVTTVTTADLISLTSVSNTAPLTMNYEITDGEGFNVTSNATYEAATATYDMTLLTGGANILNLTPALSAGMSIAYEAASGGNTSSSQTVVNGEVLSDQTIESGDTVASFSLSQDGLSLGATAQDILIRMVQADLLPFPIEAEMSAMAAGYTFPVMASADPQDFSFDMVLDGLRLSPEIWSLFDPGKDLPRDPATVALNLAGTATTDVDLFDFLVLESKFEAATPPVSLESLNVSKIGLSAIGATLDGSSELVFDNTDLATYDGLPKPVGDAFFAVTGANALLDRLQAVGILREDEANAARFGMGFFARSTGDDSFETTVDFGDDGSLSVNGQRIR
ncbi:hypothetical protein [Yoonia sp. 208BN28-4]|uniref:hypothetical protein n=1 Tax=Yoonia sp. 208BN28-4 TaxID=3126505 RepID=UPI0030A1D84C